MECLLPRDIREYFPPFVKSHIPSQATITPTQRSSINKTFQYVTVCDPPDPKSGLSTSSKIFSTQFLARTLMIFSVALSSHKQRFVWKTAEKKVYCPSEACSMRLDMLEMVTLKFASEYPHGLDPVIKLQQVAFRSHWPNKVTCVTRASATPTSAALLSEGNRQKKESCCHDTVVTSARVGIKEQIQKE